MAENPRKGNELTQKKLEALWSREMSLPVRVAMVVLVLTTYGIAMAAIGLHRIAAPFLRRLPRAR